MFLCLYLILFDLVVCSSAQLTRSSWASVYDVVSRHSALSGRLPLFIIP